MKLNTAVILAAGIGIRLRGILADRPKGFLEINGVSIIERSIQQLISVDIDNIFIVTGHLSEYYDSLVERYPFIHIVRNDLYAESGSMYSLYCARDSIKDTFLLLESDLIYENLALKALLAFQKSNSVLVSGFTNAGDELYVGANDSRIHKISKQKSEIKNIIGELVGISKISIEMFQAMVEYSELYFRNDLKLEYESCINASVGEAEVLFCKVNDLLWAEIDNESHLLRARRLLPKIIEKDRENRPKHPS